MTNQNFALFCMANCGHREAKALTKQKLNKSINNFSYLCMNTNELILHRPSCLKTKFLWFLLFPVLSCSRYWVFLLRKCLDHGLRCIPMTESGINKRFSLTIRVWFSLVFKRNCIDCRRHVRIPNRWHCCCCCVADLLWSVCLHSINLSLMPVDSIAIVTILNHMS